MSESTESLINGIEVVAGEIIEEPGITTRVQGTLLHLKLCCGCTDVVRGYGTKKPPPSYRTGCKTCGITTRVPVDSHFVEESSRKVERTAPNKHRKVWMLELKCGHKVRRRYETRHGTKHRAFVRYCEVCDGAPRVKAMVKRNGKFAYPANGHAYDHDLRCKCGAEWRGDRETPRRCEL
jgi:hypothetical protein